MTGPILVHVCWRARSYLEHKPVLVNDSFGHQATANPYFGNPKEVLELVAMI